MQKRPFNRTCPPTSTSMNISPQWWAEPVQKTGRHGGKMLVLSLLPQRACVSCTWKNVAELCLLTALDNEYFTAADKENCWNYSNGHYCNIVSSRTYAACGFYGGLMIQNFWNWIMCSSWVAASVTHWGLGQFAWPACTFITLGVHVRLKSPVSVVLTFALHNTNRCPPFVKNIHSRMK